MRARNAALAALIAFVGTAALAVAFADQSAAQHTEPSTAAPAVPEDWSATTEPFALPTYLLASAPGDDTGGRVITASATVDMDAQTAFDLWTTSEGVAAWLTGTNERTGEPNADVGLYVGGPFELYFAAEFPDGYRGSEGCTILSYQPGRMLSFSWNAPPYYGGLRNRYTHVVVIFDDATTDPERPRTIVTLTHLGWPDSAFTEGEEVDPKSQGAVFGYFSRAWPSVLELFGANALEAAGALGLE